MGRPKGSPNRQYDKKEAQQILEMASYGLPFKFIERILRIDNETRMRLYKQESDEGAAHAIKEVQKTLFLMATSQVQPSATFFYLKTRGDGEYRETDRLELEHSESGDKKQIGELEKRIVELTNQYKREY